MAPYSSSRFTRGALLAGILVAGASLVVSACGGTGNESVTTAPGVDLTGIDVNIHQAVG